MKGAFSAFVFLLMANIATAQQATINNYSGTDVWVDVTTANDCPTGNPQPSCSQSGVLVPAGTISTITLTCGDPVVSIIVHVGSATGPATSIAVPGCNCIPGPTTSSGSVGSISVSGACTGTLDAGVDIW